MRDEGIDFRAERGLVLGELEAIVSGDDFGERSCFNEGRGQSDRMADLVPDRADL